MRSSLQERTARPVVFISRGWAIPLVLKKECTAVGKVGKHISYTRRGNKRAKGFFSTQQQHTRQTLRGKASGEAARGGRHAFTGLD